MNMDFSVQLYSVRNEIEKLGFGAVFEKLAQIGYKGVEFAGYGGISAPEMKALLEQNNLRSVGAHIALERLETALGEEISYHKTLGTPMLVVPYTPCESAEEAEQTAARLNALAPRMEGFIFAYHNHGNEFIKENGKYRMETLMEKAPSVALQLDIYWASIKDCDCADFIKRRSPRVTSLHIKQMDAAKNNVDLCDGVLDFASLIAVGKDNGAKSFIHEQETFSDDAFVCLKRGFEHIMSL